MKLPISMFLTTLASGLCFTGLFAVSAHPESKATAAPAVAARDDLSGLWLWSRTKSDGTLGTNYFTLVQSGSLVSGKMEFAWGGTSDLIDGHVEGDHIRFKRRGDPPPSYEGTFDSTHIHLTMREKDRTESMELTKLPPGTVMFPPAPAPPKLHPVPTNGLLTRPPMGWNAWNHFHDTLDDKTVREVVDAMISSGMRDAGYNFVNIDDEWAGERDSSGNIHSNKNFPDLLALSGYIHSKGMKMGLYSSPGPETCEGHHGSLGFEDQDARSYAAWGADYLKYDWCSAVFVYKDAEMQAVYQKMGDALQKTGRPIAYSLCQYGKERVHEWGPSVGGNLWRTTPDISDNWKSMYWIWTSQHAITQWNKPGGWNDPDMLEVGNSGMSDEEYRTHFTLWAMLSAPLLAGNDPRSMSPATIATLTNREVIEIDQDSLAAAPRQIKLPGDVEIWVKPLADGGTAVLLLNPSAAAAKIQFNWPELHLPPASTIRDLWTHRPIDATQQSYQADIPSHAVHLLRLYPGKS